MDSVAGSASGRNFEGVIRIEEDKIRSHVDEVVRSTVEATLNGLLDAEADELCGAPRYSRSPERLDTRAGHYDRQLHTKAGEVTLSVPRLRSLPFETQIIERYRRRESSVEEALVEMYLAGVSVRRVEDITEALWGTRISPSAVSELNQKIYGQIEAWRNRPIEGRHAYVFMDGIWLKRSWGGEVKNVAVLVAIGVREDGYREILGVVEGLKEDTESWRNFLRHLKQRGLSGVRLVTSDKSLGLVEAAAEFYPEAAWQRCMVHWYRNVMSVVPKGKVKEVMAMLKAIHAQEDRQAARDKAHAVAEKLDAMRRVRSANPTSIATPYGEAVQDASAAALRARAEIQGGARVYKGGTLGRSETGASQFLATESPLNPGYAGRYGVPPENANFDFILTGRVRDGAPIITRPSPGIPPNPGGGIEGVFRPGDFIIDSFYMP